MGSLWRAGAATALLLPAACASQQPKNTGPRHSSLWGEHGESFTSAGRLPDFSYAGYAAGEKEIPLTPVVRDLRRDFGARGDGLSDDGGALARAVRESPPGAILIPAGTYRIEREIEIKRAGVVLRGEGQGRTILFFPKPLSELKGNHPDSEGQSEWSFGPGFLVFKGDDPIGQKTFLAKVAAVAKRGEVTLTLDRALGAKPGDWVRLVESDPKSGPEAGSLLKAFMGGLTPPGPELVGTKNIVRFLSRVTETRGATLTLERSLPIDVRPEWAPELHRFAPDVQQVGLENLTIAFPPTRYPGHFKELGYNGVKFSSTAQCWAKDLEIRNADFAFELRGTNFCTAERVTLTAAPERAGERNWSGHHGFDVSHGTENLIRDFKIKTRFVHDLSYEWYALHTVFAHGSGVDLNLDFHRESPYENLATDLELGAGTRPFASGGDESRGPHTAAYAVFWNLRANAPLKTPPSDFGPLMSFIGVRLKEDGFDENAVTRSWFFEDISPETLAPPNLHDAQLARRRSRP